MEKSDFMEVQIDKLIRSKRRTIALIVERDGSLTVRAPKRVALAAVEAFVQEKADWILRSRAKVLSATPIQKKQYVTGEKFLFLGNEYELKIVKPQRPALKFENGFYLGQTAQKRGELFFTRWYKKRALAVISARVQEISELHGFMPKQVKITSARTRWGSCSPNGTLNFSWRLILAPLEVVDYVVVHELVHLKVKNHSKKFWKSVEAIYPEYKEDRKWLGEHGEELNL